MLRNAEVAGQSQRLGRPGAANAGVPVRDPEDALAKAQEELAGVEARLEEEFRRGYEQGLDEGQRQASESMLTAALEEARSLGLKQGTEAGLRAAQEAAAVARNESLAALERMLAAIPEQLHARLAALEDDMVALCFHAVTRVLGETAATREGLRSMLGQALTQYGARELVEVRLHPDDLQLLARDEVIGPWLRQREGGSRVQLVADAAIALGGVVLRSPAGRLDARLETQVAGLRHALLSVRAARANSQARAAARPTLGGAS
ncbi:MAG: FliH/SctL family protein [Massilia sp.]